jgi:predicted permease
MFANLLQDLRYALRAMLARPLFALVAILTLALGIGANTAIFSVIYSQYLRPLPYAGGDRLVDIYNTYPKMGLENAGTSIPDYLDRREQAQALEDIAMYTGTSFNMAESGGTPERLLGLMTTPSLFSTLQVQPALGQVFNEEQAQPGQDRYVVLSHTLWLNRYNRDPGLVGRDIRLNGEPYRVLGVMPEGFSYPNRNMQLWVPFSFTPDQKSDTERGNEYSGSLGRLKPGANIEQLNAQMDQIVQRNVTRIEASNPDGAAFVERTGFTGRAMSLRDRNVGENRPMLLVLQGAVAMVLLIACANVANLMLARATSRQKEISVRLALGASRGRLIRQLLTESVMLATIGGVLGLIFALWIKDGLLTVNAWGGRSFTAFHPQLDLRVLGFTFGLAMLTGIVFGLAPAWRATKVDLTPALKESARSSSASTRSLLSRSLVVLQVALSLLLLVGAGIRDSIPETSCSSASRRAWSATRMTGSSSFTRSWPSGSKPSPACSR